MTKVDDKKEFKLTKDDIKKIIEETIEEFEAQKETESEKTIVLEDAEIDKSLDLWERKLEQALKREKKYEEYGDKLKEAKQEIKADIMIATKKMKEAEEDTAVITNPLYRYLPWNLGRRIIKTHKRGARNWLGLLITGVGIVLLEGNLGWLPIFSIHSRKFDCWWCNFDTNGLVREEKNL